MRTFLLVIQILASLGVIATVLLQSGKSAGLSGAISGGAEQVFGGKKKGIDSLLSKLTAILATVFLLVTLLISLF